MHSNDSSRSLSSGRGFAWSTSKRTAECGHLSADQDLRYNGATECCICHNKNRPFNNGDDDWRKVRDHDHVTGYFLGAAHNLCNKRRRVVFQIPVFIHNFRGYDGHLIVHAFNKFPDREIKVIGQSMERYLQVVWGKNLVFRDSLAAPEQLAREAGRIAIEGR